MLEAVRRETVSCRAVRLLIVGMGAAGLGGCELHPPRFLRLPDQTQLLLVDPSQAMITQRPRALADPGNPPEILCAQPNPDWARALSRIGQFSGSGSGGGASGSLSGSFNQSETIAQMAGRTAGVVALRDGLYSACQAYASGVIGQDAYALILSQYGDLLVALAAPAPAAPAAPAPASGAPSGILGVALAQQEAVKAILVACLSENDPTRPHPPGLSNPLLSAGGEPSAACRRVIDTVAARVDDLLRPVPPPAAAAPPKKVAAGAAKKPSPPKPHKAP